MNYPIITDYSVAHCPECNLEVSLNYTAATHKQYAKKLGNYHVSICTCARCSGPFIFFHMDSTNQCYRFYPQGGHVPLHYSIPENVKKVFREIEDVRPISPRCVPVLCRALFEEVLKSTKIPDRNKLYQKVEEYLKMVDMKGSDIEIFMKYIVVSGNGTAHKIDEEFVPTNDECDYLLYAMGQIFHEIYEVPAVANEIKNKGKL